MNTFSHVPPGFRFHPSDEELVDYYLRKKIISAKIDLDVIKDVDLYRIEPWDLQGLCSLGTEEEDEWYFFSHKDKKYPTGTRTNRATKAGFWKATGRDKPIYARQCLVGMRKTLVFYQGRAPNGLKSDWIMHEYRFENENGHPQEEGWVVCRVFKKRITTVQQKMSDYVDSPCWYELDSSQRNYASCHSQYSCKRELESPYKMHDDDDYFLQLPQLESPESAAESAMSNFNNMVPSYAMNCGVSTQTQHQHQSLIMNMNMDQVSDWRVLDKFVASQLTHEDDSREADELGRPKIGQECAASGGPWK